MPRNDDSDSLSVRGEDDPRRPLRRMQDETEVELRDAERRDPADPPGPRDLSDREAVPRDPRSGQPPDTTVPGDGGEVRAGPEPAPDAPAGSEHP